MGWFYLAAAIATQVCGTVALRESDGFSKLVPSSIVVVGYGLSFFFLALALKEIDLSVAYAIWAALGTAAITLIGIAAFNEPATALKLASIGLIILGVVGLNISGVTR